GPRVAPRGERGERGAARSGERSDDGEDELGAATAVTDRARRRDEVLFAVGRRAPRDEVDGEVEQPGAGGARRLARVVPARRGVRQRVGGPAAGEWGGVAGTGEGERERAGERDGPLGFVLVRGKVRERRGRAHPCSLVRAHPGVAEAG